MMMKMLKEEGRKQLVEEWSGREALLGGVKESREGYSGRKSLLNGREVGEGVSNDSLNASSR